MQILLNCIYQNYSTRHLLQFILNPIELFYSPNYFFIRRAKIIIRNLTRFDPFDIVML